MFRLKVIILLVLVAALTVFGCSSGGGSDGGSDGEKKDVHTPTVTIDDVTALEGDGLQFTVTLDTAVAGAFTVDVSFTDVTAAGGSDYDDTAQVLNFAGAAGETQTFTVSTTDDALLEGTETYTVNLSASDPNVDAADIGTGTILDNDTPAVTIDDVTALEGDGLQFTVTLDTAVAGAFTVDVSFTDVTATGGNDYDNTAQMLNFVGTTGETQTFTVSTTDDALIEGTETYTVNLSASNPNVDAADIGSGTIIDNDNDTPAVTVDDMTALEGDGLQFTVTLDTAVTGAFTVDVSFTDVTATGGSDYDNTAHVLNFAGTAGETQIFTVSTTDDALLEGTETYTVNLSASNPNVDAADIGTGTILDNDTPAVAISDDFNQHNLDSSWIFVNPIGDGSVAITDVGGDAHLELNVPGGPSHDPYHINRAVRVMQAAADDDFEVVVKFDSIPSQSIQMQGLIVEQDDTNWLRFGNYYNLGNHYMFAASTTNGSSQNELNSAISLTGSSIYLRVQRAGDQWTHSYSENGTDWTVAGSFAATLTVSQIGIYGANHPEGSSPAYTARADYFEVAADPILFEDSSLPPDTLAPFIHTVNHAFGPGSLIVNWFTDEPADGAVEWGPDTNYGSTETEVGGPFYEHSAEITGLTPGQTIHFRIRSEDADGRAAFSDDFEVFIDADDPIIDVWYGTSQTFGALGRTQPWVNILGNVTDPEGVASLTYSLNGGALVNLRLGPDGRRLELPGDFNADLDIANLPPGPNTLVLTATDGFGNETIETVTIDYQAGTVWPQPYTIDWSTLATPEEIQDVAQIVDGKWQLENGNVRTAEPGYDRLIAVGDMTWGDYEVTVPITRHNAPGTSGVGVLLRWNGHTDDPVVTSNPKSGYLPLGAILWYRFGRLEIYGNNGQILDTQSRTLSIGTTYWFKARVETVPGVGGFYSLRVWEDGQPEPTTWDVTGQEELTDPQTGSMMLITHVADVSFGNVTVTP